MSRAKDAGRTPVALLTSILVIDDRRAVSVSRNEVSQKIGDDRAEICGNDVTNARGVVTATNASIPAASPMCEKVIYERNVTYEPRQRTRPHSGCEGLQTQRPLPQRMRSTISAVDSTAWARNW
jgi:hypothetical protein